MMELDLRETRNPVYPWNLRNLNFLPMSPCLLGILELDLRETENAVYPRNLRIINFLPCLLGIRVLVPS